MIGPARFAHQKKGANHRFCAWFAHRDVTTLSWLA
jgi:hypothetical protein